jgi:hypothetical protein
LVLPWLDRRRPGRARGAHCRLRVAAQCSAVAKHADAAEFAVVVILVIVTFIAFLFIVVIVVEQQFQHADTRQHGIAGQSGATVDE